MMCNEKRNTPMMRGAGRGFLAVAAFLACLTGMVVWVGWGLGAGPARPLALLLGMSAVVALVEALPVDGRARSWATVLGTVLFLSFVGWGLVRARGDLASWTRTSVERTTTAGLVTFFVAFAAAIAARVTQGLRSDGGRGFPVWARAVAIMAVLGGLAAFAARYGAAWVEELLSLVLLSLLLLLALEMVLASLIAFFRPPERARTRRSAFESHLLGLFFARLNPLDGFVEGLKLEFNVDLRQTWLFAFLKRACLPLFCAQVLAFVFATSFVTVAPHELGVVERWGRPQRERLLRPGMHVKLPWPIERVFKLPVRRIESVNLGVEGDLSVPYRLWAKKHWAAEYQLLLGDGRELVTFNATVQYRISDPFAWLYGHRDPQRMLEAEAYRSISEEMVSRDIGEVLTRDRRDFAQTVTKGLQARLDQARVGLEIVTVTLNEVHPPVDVAAAYQDVVSAQLEERTRVLEAEVYTTRAIPAAMAEAQRLKNEAVAARAEMLGKARGRAARTLATLKGYQVAPELFRWRRRLETMEDPLKKARVTVVDHRLRKGKDYYLDLREKQ